MAHEIYRCGFYDRDVSMNSENSALKIFLSHTKEPKKEAKSNNPDKDGIEKKKDGDGLVLAKQLKGLIDETSMNRFFDASDIAPAYRFDDEIRRNIGEASVVVINSDVYASRYWCQREIQQAKRDGRPVVEVDIISSGMDRKLPYAGNIPLVRIDMEEGQAKEEDLLRVLEAILIETVRYNYVSQKLENEQKAIDGDVKIICRPPEMMDLENMIERSEDGGLSIQCNKIMYPDPPIYSEETEFFEKNGINVFTPIEAPYDGKFLDGKNIGISVSDADINDLTTIGQDERHTKHLSMMIANYVLGRGATLIYGGDLRDNGYTEQLIMEAQVLQDRLQSDEIYLKNYVAWPIYIKDSPKVKEWKAKNKGLLQMINIEIDEKAAALVENTTDAVNPDTTEHRYVWGKCLTKMRTEMISACSARICAGGRRCGYKGKMPGVLEKILIAAELGCPIYLLGGFGGVTESVCRTIQTGKLVEELTEEWQKSRNDGYAELLEKYRTEGEAVDYDNLEKTLKNLQLNNGLNDEENEILFTTPYVDEALRLVLKGLQAL
ncbi:MAG: hypothetical protein LIP12_16120 [Clostridiales bacterium]|nr:hypothetical protein [Clostridiales bacterium]